MSVSPLIIIALGAAIGVHVNLYKNYHYICPQCSKTFKPDSFLSSMFALNGGKRRKVRCPYCHCKGWAKAEKDYKAQ